MNRLLGRRFTNVRTYFLCEIIFKNTLKVSSAAIVIGALLRHNEDFSCQRGKEYFMAVLGYEFIL